MDVKISPNFWNNDALNTPELRLAALWLKTNAHVNLVGYGELSVRRFIFDTGLTEQALDECCQALGKGLVREGKGYWLTDFIGEQFGRGVSLSKNHMSKPLVRALETVGSPWLGDAVYGAYPELEEVADRLAGDKGMPSPRAEQSRAEHNRAEQSRAELGVRGDKTRAGDHPATLNEARAHGLTLGMTGEEAEAFFCHFEANGWKQGGRTPLRAWKAAMRKWQLTSRTSKKSAGGGGAVEPGPSPEN
jgi:hypothetical protein